jgi:hypothetical protein
MSQIRIYGDTSGYIEIKAPAVANNTTVTVPEGGIATLASPTFTGTVTLPSTTSVGNVSSTELGYLDGVTSALQTQLNAKANLSSPTFTGTPVAPTATTNTNTTQIATTAFVVGQAGTTNPLVNGTVAVGTSLLYSRQDHVHPTDTTRASISSPTFTGIIKADNYDIGLTTLNSDSIALNFSAETGLYTRSAAGTVTFTASNYRAGAIKTVRIVPGASNRTLNFPANWVFVGTKPATVLANKTGILTVTSFGTTEADCVAAWAVQP